MSFYSRGFEFLKKYIKSATIFKYGLNWSPMYRRSTARIVEVSDDLHYVEVHLDKSWKNVNIAGTVYSGSMVSAIEPIYMTQLIQILGKEYVVWDKAVSARFKRPARERIYIRFEFTPQEIAEIKEIVQREGEYSFDKEVLLESKNGAVFAEAVKTMYVATKTFYKAKKAKRAEVKQV